MVDLLGTVSGDSLALSLQLSVKITFPLTDSKRAELVSTKQKTKNSDYVMQ